MEDLWNSVPPSGGCFDPQQVAALPPAARRYLEHAIVPGTPLATGVRLRMRGEIKLKGWCPFEAEEVICWGRGMIWQAAVRAGRFTIRGGDRIVDGQGAMRWKLFGLIPVLRADGPDITRSAAGRVNIEAIWLPSVLCGPQVAWFAANDDCVRARIDAHGEVSEVTFALDATGRLLSVRTQRWGNPTGAPFGYADFGGYVEEEGCFGGYTIPTRLRAGWHFGDARFAPEGEFFRVTITAAEFR